MSFCEHCQGQRFDRAQVLRKLREVQRELRGSRAGAKCEGALSAAIDAVRDLEIPHLEPWPEEGNSEVVH